jgi:hypothetical protein
MYVVLLLLAPGLVSAAIHGRAKGLPMKSVGFLVEWAVAAFLVNAFVIGVADLKGHGAVPLDALFNSIDLLSKYAALALATSVALPYAVLLVESLVGKAKRNG